MRARLSLGLMFRASQGLQSMFRVASGAPGASARHHRELESWRAAASRVWSCWEALLASPPEDRELAYAAYGDALDAEALAAEHVAATVPEPN